MKTKAVLLIALIGLLQLELQAQPSDHINYFTVASQMNQPITIVTNLGTFTFSNTFTIIGEIEKIEAFDINGNIALVNGPQIKESSESKALIEYYYTISKCYRGTSALVFDGADNKSHSPYYLSSGMGEIKGFMAKNDPDWEKKTYLGIGYGTEFGGAFGVNATAKTLHGLLGVSGGMGFDPRIKNSKAPTWYLAFLMGYKGWDVEIGPVSRYRPQKYGRDFGLVVMTNINISIYGPFGINAGVGGFLSFYEKSPTPYLEWNVGLTIRLHQSIY